MEQFFVNLVNPLLQALVMVLVPILVAYGLALVKKWTGVQVNANTEIMLRNIAIDAVNRVEETAAAALKSGATKWTASMKQGAAVDLILSKAPTLTTEQAIGLVTTAVGMIPSVGASALALPAPTPAAPTPTAE